MSEKKSSFSLFCFHSLVASFAAFPVFTLYTLFFVSVFLASLFGLFNETIIRSLIKSSVTLSLNLLNSYIRSSDNEKTALRSRESSQQHKEIYFSLILSFNFV